MLHELFQISALDDYHTNSEKAKLINTISDDQALYPDMSTLDLF